MSTNFIKYNNAVAKRLELIVHKQFGGNWAKFGRKTGITPGSLGAYKIGKTKPAWDQIVSICEQAHIDANWLLTGKGAMLLGDAVLDVVQIPYYQEAGVAMGQGESAQKGAFERLAISQEAIRKMGLSPQNLSVISVSGDAMEPYLHEGDLVFVDLSMTIPVEGVYVLRMDNALLTKRLQPLPNGLCEAHSFKPAYRSFTFKVGEGVGIIGRIMGSLKMTM